MNDLIVYTTEYGRSQLKLRAQDRTFWLTELEMAAPLIPPSRSRSLRRLRHE